MRNMLTDLILIALPFIFLITVILSLISPRLTKIAGGLFFQYVLLTLALQIFCGNLILIRSSREISKIMSPEAFKTLKIPKTIFDESDLSFGYFYSRDDLILAYLVIFIIMFVSAVFFILSRHNASKRIDKQLN